MTTQTQTKNIQPIQVDFPNLMERILGLLSPKEKDVVERRFAIKNHQKETLDKIGKSYSITRERVRQIESVAIQKLGRIAQEPSMQKVHSLALSILAQNGNVMSEERLVSEMIKFMGGGANLQPNSINFALRISKHLHKQEKNQFHRAFWFTSEHRLAELKNWMKKLQKALNKQKNVTSFDTLYETLKNPLGYKTTKSLMYIDWNIFLVEEDKWGLKSWRFLNPRSIKDCIKIILDKEKQPMHFRDILQRVLYDFPDRKRVTPQACHNELIRHDEFVLLGRGKYGLKEWGMSAGTVCDLIISIFEENNFEPLKRQEIIEGILKKRDVRLGTISLNLQKYPFFKRVGRAVYEYDKTLDNRSRTKYSHLA
ncbi:hypothetical protein CSB37_00660 [bacterium DOLZORAL124_38_8]|nr:MAG: hypothetical protein CSB37_00660 [bacterium DOLZORAL124_38_8]